jgi:DNA-directed RNA polymerase subunit delta
MPTLNESADFADTTEYMISYFFPEIIVYRKKIGYNKPNHCERKVFPMEERDILVFTDEEGQEIQMEILDYFEYDDELYAMLIEADEYEHDHEHDDECDHEEESSIYIMRVIVDGDTEEFVPVDEDKMEELVEAIQEMYIAEDDYDGYDGDDYDDEDYDDYENDDEDPFDVMDEDEE